MKAIVIYYSLEGNTDTVAHKVAAAMGASLLRLKPVKEYPSKGFIKYVAGGGAATMKLKPKLANGTIDLAHYDTAILGTPLWAGAMAPPMRSFLAGAGIQGKKIGIFICNAGADTARCNAGMESLLTGNTFLAKADFSKALQLPKTELKSKVSAFCSLIL